MRWMGCLLFAGLVGGTAMLAAGQSAAPTAASGAATITQQELVGRTQELFDAVAPGIQGPWEKYYAADAIYCDETGRKMDKAALLKDLQPLPQGFSGHIVVKDAVSRISATTAVLSYDLDESETAYGQPQHARYHGTDTWELKDGRWQIVAGQMLRYYEDPAAGKSDAARLKEYAGTYEIAPGHVRTVLIEGGEVKMKSGDHAADSLVPEVPDLYFRPGKEGRILFHRDAQGQVDALVDRRNNEDLVWKRDLPSRR